MKYIFYTSYIFIASFFVFSCGKPDSTPDDTEVELTIVDAAGQLVSGFENGIYLVSSEQEYEEAFRNKSSTKSVLAANSVSVVSPGVYKFRVSNPNQLYWLYAYKFDNISNINISNFGLSGPLKALPVRSVIKLKIVVGPYDGNLIFYSSATNRMPITITVANFGTLGNVQKRTIINLFTGTGVPNFVDNISSAWFNYDPGTYVYNAKSSDGCAWQGNVTLTKGVASPVSLSKCPNGKITFYTDVANSAILPIIITLNGQNLSSFYVQTITSSPAIAAFDCLNTNINGNANFTQNEGFYKYFAESASTNCVWSGSINLGIDVCTFVGINPCD